MLPRLLLLTDRSQLHLGRSLTRTLTECVAAGATHVVIRELDESPACRAALADAVVAAGGTPIGAHGPVGACNAALLPLSALPALHSATKTPRYMSERGGPSSLEMGASCHSAAEVRQAAAQGADFATLSPFAETPSKPGYGPPINLAAFRDLPIPVFALGGITSANAREALNHGAHGVAVMGSVMRAADPGAVVRALLEAVS